MSILDVTPDTARHGRTPTDLLLTGSLVVAPLAYLTVDVLYAARGWDDADAGGAHVLGALLYAFALLRLATWARGWLAAGMLVAAIVGTAGNVAYGFNTIHVSLGGMDLLDTTGPGAIIKPLGLFFPLALVLSGVALRRVGHLANAALVGVAAVAWPVAHIGNIAWLAIAVNVALVLALVPLARRTDAAQRDRLVPH